MRMTRAWLILADILVTILLFLSFILFYLYTPKSVEIPLPKPSPIVFPHWDENITFDTLESMQPTQNVTIKQEELAYMIENKSTIDDIVTGYLFSSPLALRLHDLHAKVGDPIYIRIFKAASLLEVWIRVNGEYKHLKNYFICAYSGGLGPKEKEGDRQSPEGFYSVKRPQLNPKSKFHLSFNLGYPNAYDRAHKRTGSFLMVHGNCVSIGCYAMTDSKIEEIYALVEKALKKGQTFVPVHVYPFKMTEDNMAHYSENKWYSFWTNLKEGYDYFEAEKLPPTIKVENSQYIISEANE